MILVKAVYSKLSSPRLTPTKSMEAVSMLFYQDSEHYVIRPSWNWTTVTVHQRYVARCASCNSDSVLSTQRGWCRSCERVLLNYEWFCKQKATECKNSVVKFVILVVLVSFRAMKSSSVINSVLVSYAAFKIVEKCVLVWIYGMKRIKK